MDDVPRQTLQSGLYTTIAAYAAANALSLAVFIILYHLYTAVLVDFRDPMLYAFLCSIALRGPKDWLVERMDWQLSQNRSVAVAVLKSVASPVAAQWMWTEGKEAIRAFQSKVKEIRDEYQKNMQKGRKEAAAAAASAAAAREGATLQPDNKGETSSSSSPHKGTASATTTSTTTTTTPQLHEQQPFALAVYAKAGLRTFTSRKERKKRRKRASSSSATVAKQAPAPASNKLLFMVAFVTVLWAVYEWIRDSWSRTAHVTLLTGIVVSASTAILRSILHRTAAFTNNNSTNNNTNTSATTSPYKTVPTPSTGVKRPLSPNKHSSLDSPRFGASSSDPGWRQSRVWQVVHKTSEVIAIMESPLRTLLRRNLHALVTLFLIMGLLIGTAGTATFLSIRIVGEARGVLVAARDVFPAAWSGVSAVTPMLVDEFVDEQDAEQKKFGGREAISNMKAASRSLQQVASEVPLPPWLETYRQSAFDLAQRSLPGMAAWMEGQIYGVMRAHNLTDTLWDARLLYEAAQGSRSCTERERLKLLVALAKAEVTTRKAREEEERVGVHAVEAQRALNEVVAALSSRMKMAVVEVERACSAADTTTTSSCSASTTATTTTAPSTEEGEDEEQGGVNKLSLAELQEKVVTADGVVTAAKDAHKAATAVLDDAERARRVADGRLQLCVTPEAAGAGSTSGNSTAQHSFIDGVTSRMSSAYTKLFWEWNLREGLYELYGAVIYAVDSVTQRSDVSTAADLSRLRRLVQAAAVPLFGLGRAAAASVGSTTAAAVMGSVGLFRLGLGVVHLGVQAALFLTLLYYLLAAQTDPLARAVDLIPLPHAARLRAAAALNAALGGVFMSLLKLAAFHGMFAWVTFRMVSAPLAYTSSVASAAFALLPFVPTYSMALPGCMVLALQGRVAAAAILLVLHFTAYYIGDTVVLEDSGGHPFMMSLAILGGLWAFSNPLLGCLLGPTLLSLLSALGSLHTELMGNSGGGGGGGRTVVEVPGGEVRRLPPPPSVLVNTTTTEEMARSPMTLSPRRLNTIVRANDDCGDDGDAVHGGSSVGGMQATARTVLATTPGASQEDTSLSFGGELGVETTGAPLPQLSPLSSRDEVMVAGADEGEVESEMRSEGGGGGDSEGKGGRFSFPRRRHGAKKLNESS